MKRYFLLLLTLIVGLTACTSFNQYIEARRTAYQRSQDLGVLKMPPGLKTGSMAYVIPEEGLMGPAGPISLYPTPERYQSGHNGADSKSDEDE